jgi:hypothetical protein
VAIEQLLLVGAFLAAVRAERTRRLGPALLFGALCLLAFHAHFFALLVVVPLCGMLAREAWRTRRGPRRFPAATIVVVALLALESVVVLLLFRSRASAGLFGSAPLGEVVPRAALSTLRMAGGLGIVAALVGFPVAFLLLRRGRFPERACAVVVLGGLVLFAVGCLRWDLRPRYGLCLQPFLWLAAALPFARAFERWKAAGQRTRELGNFAASRPWGQSAMLALAAAVTALPGLAYLAGGGGRDTEAKAIEILRRHARPGDGVLYDTGFQDPFRRRPSEFPAFPKERARAAGGEAALDSAGVRWVIRSSLEPASVLYSPQFESRLRGPGEELGKVFVVPVFPFQSYYVISVSRIAPP